MEFCMEKKLPCCDHDVIHVDVVEKVWAEFPNDEIVFNIADFFILNKHYSFLKDIFFDLSPFLRINSASGFSIHLIISRLNGLAPSCFAAIF